MVGSFLEMLGDWGGWNLQFTVMIGPSLLRLGRALFRVGGADTLYQQTTLLSNGMPLILLTLFQSTFVSPQTLYNVLDILSENHTLHFVLLNSLHYNELN